MNQRRICAFEGESGIKSAEYQAAFRAGGGMAIAALARVSSFGAKGDYSIENQVDRVPYVVLTQYGTTSHLLPSPLKQRIFVIL